MWKNERQFEMEDCGVQRATNQKIALVGTSEPLEELVTGLGIQNICQDDVSLPCLPCEIHIQEQFF